MVRFKYTGFTTEGESVDGTIDAGSFDDARTKLLEQGVSSCSVGLSPDQDENVSFDELDQVWDKELEKVTRHLRVPTCFLSI